MPHIFQATKIANNGRISLGQEVMDNLRADIGDYVEVFEQYDRAGLIKDEPIDWPRMQERPERMFETQHVGSIIAGQSRTSSRLSSPTTQTTIPYEPRNNPATTPNLRDRQTCSCPICHRDAEPVNIVKDGIQYSCSWCHRLFIKRIQGGIRKK